MNDALMVWINVGWRHPALDTVFLWVSSKTMFSFPIAIAFALHTYYSRQPQGWRTFAALLLTIAISDQLGNQLKDVFGHPRPCFSMWEDLINPLFGYAHPCGAELTGMPSNHTMNFAAGATFLTIIGQYRRWAITMWVCTLLVALSRMYLGKHYPYQVLAGLSFGVILACVSGWIYAYFCIIRHRHPLHPVKT